MNNIQITMIGTGYVGLVSGACFAELGCTVTCIDTDKKKIATLQTGQIPIFEPGLVELVEKHLANRFLSFDTKLKPAVLNSQVIFIAVGTPASEDGRSDLQYVRAVAAELAPLLNDYKVLVMKSTVPVGTCRLFRSLIQSINPSARFDIVSNPEFLREGSAVQDFMEPDRIILGVETEASRNLLETIYKPFSNRGIPILYADLESTELIKYTANCFLATKIAFINEIATLCERTGANIEMVRKGIGLDKRIGPDYLKPGPGFGGSCFPKDTLALAHTARTLESPLAIIESVIHSNKKHKEQMIDKIIAACNGTVKGKKVAVLGVAFKANTDDIRDSSSLIIIQGLQDHGAHIIAYDPKAMMAARSILQGVTWSQDVTAAMEEAQVIVIATEWPEFSNLDFHRSNRNPIVIDLRNLYDPEMMSKKGVQYFSIGRKSVTVACQRKESVTI